MSLKQAIYVKFWIEDNQIVNLLSNSCVAYRQTKLIRDCDRDPTFRSSIKLGQNDAGNARDLEKLSSLFQTVLTGNSIHDQQGLVWRPFNFPRRHPLHLL